MESVGLLGIKQIRMGFLTLQPYAQLLRSKFHSGQLGLITEMLYMELQNKTEPVALTSE